MTEPANSNAPLVDRMGALLAEIWDATLVALPGSMADGPAPLELIRAVAELDGHLEDRRRREQPTRRPRSAG